MPSDQPKVPAAKPLLYLLLATALILSPAIAPLTTAHEPQDGGKRVFYSDDPDQQSSSGFGEYTDNDYRNADGSVEELAKRFDIAFAHTRKNVEINGISQSPSFFQVSHLNEFRHSPSNSVSPIYNCVPQGSYDPNNPDGQTNSTCDGTTEPKNKNGKRMKDMHTTILGAQDGVYITPPRTRYSDSKARDRNNERLFIPDVGAFYVQADMRIDYTQISDFSCSTPDYEYNYETHTRTREVETENGTKTEEYTVDHSHKIDGSQTCTYIEPHDSNVTHNLYVKDNIGAGWSQIGERTDENLGGAYVGYKELQKEDRTRVEVRSEFTLTRKKRVVERDWDRFTGWAPVDETVTYLTSSKTIQSREYPVAVSTNQGIEIQQRVITIEGHDESFIVMSIDSPNSVGSLHYRRFWSTMEFSGNDNQHITNVWGIHSARQYDHMRLKTKDGTSVVHNPNQVTGLYLTAESIRPQVRVENRTVGSVPARISDWSATNITTKSPLLEPNLNFRNYPSQDIDSFRIRNAPSRVETVHDIHGDTIPIDTETATARVPEITFTEQNGSKVMIEVKDPKTAEPLRNRRVEIEGAEETAVGTNENGRAVVTRDRPYLRAQTVADDFSVEKDKYYVSGIQQKTYYTSPALLNVFFEFLQALLYAFPFIGLYMWLKYMRNRDESQQQ